MNRGVDVAGPITLAVLLALPIGVCFMTSPSQIPPDPFIFAVKSEDVSWALDQTTVDATLAVPDCPGRYPGVVLIAGSGPTDRNWESPLLPGTNGSGRLLAEALVSSGYVTIRYDKRASGPNAVENMVILSGQISLESHFDELKGAVSHLLKRSDVDPGRLFALTSSEGAIHVLYYQAHPDVVPFAGMILTGAPGRALSDVANSQIVSLLARQPDSDDLISRYHALILRFEKGLPFTPDPGLPDVANNLVASLNAPVNQPFSKEFWSFKPADYIRNTTVPVLVVIGKKDIQTDWRLDGGALEEASQGMANVFFCYPENANHVLKHEPRPREELTAEAATSAYNTAEASLDDETLKIILEWLRRQSS